MSARSGILIVSLLLGIQTAASAAVLEALAQGDEAYARRAEGHSGAWADPAPISEAIAAFERALAADPENQLARAKLMRALFFKGDYVLKETDAKLAVFEHGQLLGEEGIAFLIAGTDLDRRGGKDKSDLVQHLRNQPEAAGIYYWAAVHWGVWGRHSGKIRAARQGVAGRVRDYAEIVNEIAVGFEDGGGHRMLGRLHAEAPKIPFITGWIDRRKAISELETARSYTKDPLTELYFIESLLDYDASRQNEAVGLLRALAASQPDPSELVEGTRALSEARALLNSLTD